MLPTSSGPSPLRGNLWVKRRRWRRPGTVVSVFVAIGQPDELPGSHFPAWESTLNQTRLSRCPFSTLFDHVRFLEAEKFQAIFAVLLLTLMEEEW